MYAYAYIGDHSSRNCFEKNFMRDLDPTSSGPVLRLRQMKRSGARDGSGTLEASTIARLNIEHYHRLLATEIDESKRQTVMRLLAEEVTKLSY